MSDAALHSDMGDALEGSGAPLLWPSPPSPLTHLHFIVYCAMGESGGIFLKNTVVDVIATSEKAALERAFRLAPERLVYFVQSIVEHHPHETQ